MKYKKLLSVSLAHAYFSRGNGRTFRFEPTENCARQMRRFSLEYRATPEGFTVLHPCRRDKENLPAWPIDEEIRFDFLLFSMDPLVLNYSELPFKPLAEKIYHFSNLNQRADSSDGSPPSLSANGAELASGRDQASPRSKRFSEPCENDANGMAIRDEKGNIMENRLEFKKNKLFFDLGGKPSGLYSLVENNNVKQRFYVDDRLPAAPPFGIVNLHVAPEVIGDYQFVDSSQIGNARNALPIPGRDYIIKIDARSTFWRFHVIPKSGMDHKPDDLEIKNEANASSPLEAMGVEFRRSRGEGPGETEVVFISNKPIPSREKGYPVIVLYKGRENIPLIPALPNPDVASVSIEEGKSFSDVFIYI